MRFVDTDVLLYAVSSRPEEAGKAERAAAILGARDLALSVQVLQEFYVQATRPTTSVRLDHDVATALIRTFLRYPVQDITVNVLELALRHRERWRLSYWDAAIVAATRVLGCDTVLTEDLQNGQDFDGVRVVNPFL